MTIRSVDFYYGFPMTWRQFSKLFLGNNIDHLYTDDTFKCVKEEHYDDVNNEFFDTVGQRTGHVSGNMNSSIIVRAVPHDVVGELLKEDGLYVMIGVPVASFKAKCEPDVGDRIDNYLEWLHRPLEEYDFKPSEEQVIEAKAKWERDVKKLSDKFTASPELWKSANDCACCS